LLKKLISCLLEYLNLYLNKKNRIKSCLKQQQESKSLQEAMQPTGCTGHCTLVTIFLKPQGGALLLENFFFIKLALYFDVNCCIY